MLDFDSWIISGWFLIHFSFSYFVGFSKFYIRNMNTNKVDGVSFGYHTFLKDCWLAGQLPTVKRGAYGFKLSKKTISNEHIKPASQGGTLRQGNILLANKYINNLRGAEPIERYLTKTKLDEYLEQFVDVVVRYKNKVFNGNQYIQDVRENTKNLDLRG